MWKEVPNRRVDWMGVVCEYCDELVVLDVCVLGCYSVPKNNERKCHQMILAKRPKGERKFFFAWG